MRRLASLLIFLPAMTFFSCTNNSSAAKDAVAGSIKTVVFDFKGWLKHLKTLGEPIHMYDLEFLDTALGPFAESGFDRISAGIVARHKNYVAIATQYFLHQDDASPVTLLLVYSPDGTEIARQEIGVDKEETQNGEINSVSKWPVFINDSTFWVKEVWFSKQKDAPKGESKARLKQYRIDYQGQIRSVPQENVSFDTYAGRFKTLPLPLTVKYNLAGLQPVSLLTPYLDFSDLIYFDVLKLYHFGKITLPGKGVYLLYANGSPAKGAGESEIDSTIMLAYHTADGKESSTLRLNGYTASEGYYFSAENASIAADGTITVTEESNDDGSGGELFFTCALRELAQYTPVEAGKFIRRLTGTNFVAAELNAADITELLATRRKNFGSSTQRSKAFDERLFSIRRDETVYVRLHVYDDGAEQLVEIYTAGADLKVLDRYVVYSNLKKTPYEKASARDNVSVEGEIESDDIAGRQPLNGPATITTKGKVLLISPEGKFQAQ